jgi:hypothetical protein
MLSIIWCLKMILIALILLGLLVDYQMEATLGLTQLSMEMLTCKRSMTMVPFVRVEVVAMDLMDAALIVEKMYAPLSCLMVPDMTSWMI